MSTSNLSLPSSPPAVTSGSRAERHAARLALMREEQKSDEHDVIDLSDMQRKLDAWVPAEQRGDPVLRASKQLANAERMNKVVIDSQETERTNEEMAQLIVNAGERQNTEQRRAQDINVQMNTIINAEKIWDTIEDQDVDRTNDDVANIITAIESGKRDTADINPAILVRNDDLIMDLGHKLDIAAPPVSLQTGIAVDADIVTDAATKNILTKIVFEDAADLTIDVSTGLSPVSDIAVMPFVAPITITPITITPPHHVYNMSEKTVVKAVSPKALAKTVVPISKKKPTIIDTLKTMCTIC
jgi:hypothetical protein